MMKNRITENKKQANVNGTKSQSKKTIIFTIMAVFACIASIVGYTLASQSVRVEVKQLPNIDIVLTKSRTKVDLTNFTQHLKAKLIEKGLIDGIDDEKIKITEIEQEEANVIQEFDWINDISSQIGEINPTESGKNVTMVGNSSKSGKNAIYIIPESKQDNEISFNYNIDFGDSFNAAGILIATKKDGNELKGYMISFNNVAWANEAEGANGGIWEYRYVLGANENHFESKTLVQPLNINKSGRLTIKTTGTTISIIGGGLPNEVTTQMQNYYGSGFGFFSEHYEHGCSNTGSFDLTNINIKSTIIKSFNEILKLPKWRDDSLRIIVNVSDIVNEEFQDTNSELTKILTKLLNDDIHFIGWANDTNRSEMQALVQKNDRKGTVTDNTNYVQAIDDTANYVKNVLDSIESNGYIIAGEPVYVGVTPDNLRDNTITEDYPDGSWKVIHDNEFFENGNGQYEKTNIFTSNIITQFDKIGKYTISYQDEGTIAEVYAHRRPVASFNMRLKGNDVTLTSTSYDLDQKSENDGIEEEEWSYKKVTDENWTNGKLTTRDGVSDYIVKLRVQDHQGAWSKATTKYITAGEEDPVAEFSFAKNEISIYNKLEVIDASYDPSGKELISYNWRVENSKGEEIYSDSKPLLDYKKYGLGKYTMKLIVTNQDNRTSEEYSKEFEIVDDTTAPELEARPVNATSINEPIEVYFKFTDEESGFDYYKYAIVSEENQEKVWSENIYKQIDSIKLTETNKDLYIYIIGVDKNGNESQERRLGPYSISDITFDVQIDVTDSDDPDVFLGGAEFSLIHPKQDSPDERIILYGTSDENGICHINGRVMGVGTYEYIIYETNAPAGYDSAGLASLKITFDAQGRISNVTKLYNDSIELIEYTSDRVLLGTGCKIKNENIFNLKLELVDNKDEAIKVSDAKFKILSQASSGEKVSLTRITNSDGEIYIQDKLSGRGEIVLYVQEESCDGYIVDKELKTIVISRDQDTGLLSPVRWKSDSYIDVRCDGNDVIVRLTAVKKASENTIAIQLVDASDPTIALGGIDVRADQYSMGIRMQAKTDSQGTANLKVASAVKGTYEYTITALNMPVEYNPNIGTIKIQVKYDQNGNILDVADAEGTTRETKFIQENDELTVNNVAHIVIAVNRSKDFLPYNLQIHKTDANTGKDISETEYEIKTKNGDFERVTTKTTDAWGIIMTEISAVNNSEVIIKEKTAKKGYILDSVSKSFILTIKDGVVSAQLPDPTNSKIAVSVDNSRKLITVEDTNIKKMDGGSKAQVSFYITKKAENGDLLKGVKMNFREITTNSQLINTTSDSLGKIEIKDFKINNIGTYIFEIEETETLAGFKLPETKITVEVTYEIKDDAMYVSSVIVKKGEKYIKEKRYTQYETSTTYQSDIFLTIINQEGEDYGPPVILNVQNFDMALNEKDPERKMKTGEYTIDISYPDRNGGIGEIAPTRTVTSGEDLRIIADKEGRTIVSILEKTSPLGFIGDSINKVIELRVYQDQGVDIPYISKVKDLYHKKPDDESTEEEKEEAKKAQTTAILQNRTNIDFTTQYLLQIDNKRERIPMPFSVKIINDLKDIEGVYATDIVLDTSIAGQKQLKQTTNTSGEVLYENILPDSNNPNIIEINYTEVSTPVGYIHDTEIKKVVINRDPDTLRLSFDQSKSNIDVSKVVTDDTKQQIIIHMKKPQEFKINIKKVDAVDNSILLEGATFDIVPSNVTHPSQTITTNKEGRTSGIFDKMIYKPLPTKINPIVLPKVVTYTIKETKAPFGYRRNGDLQLKIEFNEKGQIADYEIIDPANPPKIDPEVLQKLQSNMYWNGFFHVTTNVGWAEIDTPIRYIMNTQTGKYEPVDEYKNNDEINLIIKGSDRFNFAINKIDSRVQGKDPVPVTGAEFDIQIECEGHTIYSGVQTTKDGKIELENLIAPVDKDIIINYEETKAPFGYESVDATNNADSNIKGTIVIQRDNQNQIKVVSDGTTVPANQVSIDSSRGTLAVEIENRAKFDIGVKTVDALTGIGLDNAQYTITTSEGASDKITTQNGGSAIAHIGTTYQSKTVTYRITQTQAPFGYSQIYTPIDDIVIEVVFDANGNPTSHKIIEGENRINNINFPTKGNGNAINTLNEMDIEINNGIQDVYTIRIIKESSQNSNVKVDGAVFNMKGTKSDGTQQFYVNDTTTLVTNEKGITEIRDVDITDGFKLEIQEVINGEGYLLDDTLRKIEFEESFTTSGAKLVKIVNTENLQTPPTVDNINNVINIVISNEPKDVSLVLNTVQTDDPTIKLAGAKFTITDQSNGRTYTGVTNNSGMACMNLPLKAEGTYIYEVTETEAPNGYIKPVVAAGTEMKLNVTYKDNIVSEVTVAGGGTSGNTITLDRFDEKYIEASITNSKDTSGLPEYTIQVQRFDNNLKVGIPNAKTKIEVSNPTLGITSKDDYTNTDGNIYMNNAITGEGETTIVISESEQAPGYVWNTNSIVISVTRDPSTKQILFLKSIGINSSQISIDHNNKVIKIIKNDTQLKELIEADTEPAPPFTVQIVSTIHGTETPIEGYYSMKISPSEGNSMKGWAQSEYKIINQRTYNTAIGWSSKWRPWIGRWMYDYREFGTVTLNNVRALGEMDIELEEVALPSGMVGLKGEKQHIKIKRRESDFGFEILQHGENVRVTYIQDSQQDKLIINLDVHPQLTINLEKQDSKNNSEKLEGVEFTVTADNSSKSFTGVTDSGGNLAIKLDDDTLPEGTVIYTIRENKTKDGYKPTPEIKLQVKFTKEGRIQGRPTIIQGDNVAQVFFPTQIYYNYMGTNTYAVNYDAYDQTLAMKILVSNDNTFDLRIKNIDNEQAGNFVVGSKFTVRLEDLNGNDITPLDYSGRQLETDSSGMLNMEGLKGSGYIKVICKQISAGRGYKANSEDKVFVLYKDPINYKITKDSGDLEDVEISTPDDSGIVTVTIKNERNTGLYIEKVEANDSSIKLAGAVFEVTSQVLMRGTTVVNEQVQTVETAKTTDSNGIVSFGLGKSEPDTTVLYTIKETTPPAGYGNIGNVRLTIEYDEYGKIKNRRVTSSRATILGTSDQESTDLQIRNGNTNVNDKGENVIPYKLNIQKTDSLIEKYGVNGAKYNVSIFTRNPEDPDDGDGYLIRQETIETKDIVSGFGTQPGLATTQGITDEGHIRIKFQEAQTPDGYQFDLNEYIIEYDCTYEQSIDYAVTKDLEAKIVLDTENSVLHGKNVFISNTGDLTIGVEDDPVTTIGIKGYYLNSNLTAPAANYKITSYEEIGSGLTLQGYSPKYDQEDIQYAIDTYMEPSDLLVEDAASGTGEIRIKVGKPLPNKTVVYNIEVDYVGDHNYSPLTKLAILYDQYGKVARYYLLTDDPNVQIDYTEDYTGKPYVNINTIIDPTGSGGNGNTYDLEVVKVDKDDFGITIPDTEIEIKIKNEEGITNITEQRITDSRGSILLSGIEGSGNITIEVKEIKAPEDRKIETSIKYAEFVRDSKTGEIRPKEDGTIQNLNYLIPSGGNKIILYVTNKLISTKYNLVVEKVDELKNPIEKAGIKFQIVNEADPDSAMVYETDEYGKIIFKGLDIPTTTNEVLYTIKEIEAPDGYEINPDEIKLYIRFKENASGDKVIEYSTILQGNNAEITKQQEQYAKVSIINHATNKQDLEIVKVDKGDNGILIPNVEFELKDLTKDLTQTLTTDENGKIKAILVGENKETHNYTLTEVKTPNGYKAISEPIEFSVLFDNTSPTMTITKGTDYAVQNNSDSGLKMTVLNEQNPLNAGPFSIDIFKTDKYDNEIKLEGATLRTDIQSTEGILNITKTDITNEKGFIQFANINSAGRITINITEIEAPEGRQLDNSVKTLIIDRDINTGKMVLVNSSNADLTIDNENNKISIYVGNELKDGKYALILNKVDEEGNRIKVPNTKFEITQGENGETKEYETDANGKIILNDIDIPETDTQRIKIKETQAPIGYIGSEEEIYLDVSYIHNNDRNYIDTAEITKGNNATISTLKDKYIGIDIVNNTEAKMQLEINKIDENDEKLYISGTEFEITDEQTQVTEKITTNAEGKANIKLIGKKTGECNYTIRETKAQNGYINIQNEIRLQIQYSENSDPIINITNGSDIAKIDNENPEMPKLIISNTQQELEDIGDYSLEVVKEDKYENELKLPGAKIKIELESENGVTGVTKTDITNEKGIISINEINANGNIVIKLTELEAPNNRKLDTTTKTINLTRNETNGIIEENGNNDLKVEIDNEQKKVIIHLENDLIEGKYHLVINKVDEEGNRIKVPNTKFEITQGENGETKEYQTDANGKITLNDIDIPETDTQRIKIKETQAPIGYIGSEEEIYLDISYIHDDNRNCIDTAEITKGNNATISTLNDKYIGIDISNKAKTKLELEINKIDENDEKLYISGTEFEITDEQTKVTEKVTTNAEGKVIAELFGQKVGECNYTIRETKAQNGYINIQNEIRLQIQYSENSDPVINITNGSDIAKIDNENSEMPKLIISNTQQELEDIGGYSLEVVKEDKYENELKLPGAKIKIELESENGVTGVTKTDITNEKGIMSINEINASGNIAIKLTELEAPNNRKLDTTTKTINLTRNNTSGNIEENGNNDLKVEIDNEQKKVIIHLENDLVEGKYHLAINKVDKLNNPITQEGIKFEIKEQNETTSNIYSSDKQGRILLAELDMPNENAQRYIIKEVSAPEGYKLDDETIYLDIEYGQIDGEKRITKASISKGIIASVEIQEGQYISINIQNEEEKEDELYIRSQVYIIDDNYIDRISPQTKVKDFINNCSSNGEIEIFDIDGNKLSEDDIIGTGMTLKVNGQLIHKLAVIGDINGDGKITVTDLAKLKLAYIGTSKLENEYLLAADVNYDKNISITDIAKVKQCIIGMITF